MVMLNCVSLMYRKEQNGRTEQFKSISSIIKVIQFAEYIQFQLRRVTKQFINTHDVFLCTLSRINCILLICIQECCTQWDLFVVRELSMYFQEMSPAIPYLLQRATVTCNKVV